MTLIKEIMEDLRDEAMLNFAQKQFKYELRINGEPIWENEELSVSAGELEIVIVQEGFGYVFLPPEWIEQGRLGEHYLDHLLDFDSTNWEQIVLDGTVNNAQGLLNTEAKSGDHFSFTISEALQTRLNIETNIIHIEVEQKLFEYFIKRL